jgi:hypothetical protein
MKTAFLLCENLGILSFMSDLQVFQRSKITVWNFNN